jgi:hypothetical protein
MAVEGVINYDVVPASEVAQGGNAVHGLTVSLSTATRMVRIDQPVTLTASIANASSTLRVLWAPNAPCSYVFSVTNASTNQTKNVAPFECFGDLYSMPIERLSPGMATLLRFKLESRELVDLPGRYTLSIRSIMWYPSVSESSLESLQVVSNPVPIVVTSGH